VDRYTLLRATSSTERQCATIDNKGEGRESGKGLYWEEQGGTRKLDTQIYLVYIEGDVETEGSPTPAEKRRVRVGIYRITQDIM
jgi:hypothetical protein